jgi:hypothetical protein
MNDDVVFDALKSIRATMPTVVVDSSKNIWTPLSSSSPSQSTSV